MLEEFMKVRRDAKKHKLPLITWIEPMGSAIKKRYSKETMMYCARIGLELGADIIMMSVPKRHADIGSVVKAAGNSNLVLTPDKYLDSHKLKQLTSSIKDYGVKGIVLGKSLWKRKEPLELAESIRKRICV